MMRITFFFKKKIILFEVSMDTVGIKKSVYNFQSDTQRVADMDFSLQADSRKLLSVPILSILIATLTLWDD